MEELEARLAHTDELVQLLSKRVEQQERALVPVPAPEPQPVAGPSAPSSPAQPPPPPASPPQSPPLPPISPVEKITPTPVSPALSMPVPVVPVPTTDMAPPSLPSSLQVAVDVPGVQLLPPTPQTSQEAATYGPTTLLQGPAPGDGVSALPPLSHTPTICRSRSRSPAPDAADLLRSPRLAQSPVPAPALKQPADDDIEELAAKKQRQE